MIDSNLLDNLTWKWITFGFIVELPIALTFLLQNNKGGFYCSILLYIGGFFVLLILTLMTMDDEQLPTFPAKRKKETKMKGWKRCQACRKKLGKIAVKVNGYLICVECNRQRLNGVPPDLNHAVQHWDSQEEKAIALGHSKELLKLFLPNKGGGDKRELQ